MQINPVRFGQYWHLVSFLVCRMRCCFDESLSSGRGSGRPGRAIPGSGGFGGLTVRFSRLDVDLTLSIVGFVTFILIAGVFAPKNQQ